MGGAVETAGRQLEHDIQAAVVRWARLNRSWFPALKMLYAVPNAGRRSPALAAYMLAEGLESGVPDLCLAYPIRDKNFSHLFTCPGLYIEHKTPARSSKVSENQARWIAALEEAGYRVVVSRSYDQSVGFIRDYLAEAEIHIPKVA